MLDDYKTRLWSRIKSKHLYVYGQNRNGEAVSAQFQNDHSAFMSCRMLIALQFWGANGVFI